MLLIYFVFCLMMVFIWLNYSSIENFLPPVRLDKPTLYQTTAPVDMLTMKKFLLFDGYRFQNSMAPPEASNLHVGIPGQWGPRYEFPQNYRQRTGVFKEKAFVEGFLGGASQATLGQLRAIGEQDAYEIGRPGDPIVDSVDIYNPNNNYTDLANTGQSKELNYPNGEFSWGDIINRFYRGPLAMPDIVI